MLVAMIVPAAAAAMGMVVPVIVRVAMPVAVPMVMAMVVLVLMRVFMRVFMAVTMIVLMAVTGFGLGVVAVMMVVMAALAVIVGRLLRLERAVHGGGGAADAAHQFGRARRHVEDVRPDFGGHVLAAELPGEAQQAGGVAGADFQQRLLRGAHADEAPVLELQRIAVLQAGGAVQGEIDGQSARRGEVRVRPSPGDMVEGHRIDDEIGPDGGLADDQAGFGHGGPRSMGPSATGRNRANLQQARPQMAGTGRKVMLGCNPPQSWPFHVPTMAAGDKPRPNGAPRRQKARSPMHKGVRTTMKRLIAAALAGSLALSLGACNTPQDRALGGAALGAGLGAAVGGLATGRAGGALAGAAIGSAGGAIAGAATAPRCPYGTFRDEYGNVYCR